MAHLISFCITWYVRSRTKKILESIYMQLNRSDISMSFMDGFNFHRTTLKYFAKAKYIFPE